MMHWSLLSLDAGMGLQGQWLNSMLSTGPHWHHKTSFLAPCAAQTSTKVVPDTRLYRESCWLWSLAAVAFLRDS